MPKLLVFIIYVIMIIIVDVIIVACASDIVLVWAYMFINIVSRVFVVSKTCAKGRVVLVQVLLPAHPFSLVH